MSSYIDYAMYYILNVTRKFVYICVYVQLIYTLYIDYAVYYILNTTIEFVFPTV